ncbi:MAG: hypothetical protein Q8R18_05965 [bacterium]|nr:hypothetical protein [bacterium]
MTNSVEITRVPDKIEIIKDGYKIKAKGVYNLEDLYVELNQWFTHMGYDWKEIEYKVVAGKGGSQHLEILWQGVKEIGGYSTFIIKLNLAADITDVEVTLDGGAKVKRQKGTLEFRSAAYIKRNINIWKGKFMGNILAKLYEILIRDRLRAEEGQLYGEAHKLYDELKAFMMIYR